MAQRAYLSLGSNMGDSLATITRAPEALRQYGVRVKRQSSLYETEPVEVVDQAWFVNSVVEAETELDPQGLLTRVLEVERSLGRKRGIPKGPRVIDIDILLYGNELIRSPDLEIPHPKMAVRRFVLVPLVEIAPDVFHPVLKKTASELLGETPDRSIVRRLGRSTHPE
jgi:2-amino-4-hydroxy-6-hydroxymethyldihydropteridine diphosphokinase